MDEMIEVSELEAATIVLLLFPSSVSRSLFPPDKVAECRRGSRRGGKVFTNSHARQAMERGWRGKL